MPRSFRAHPYPPSISQGCTRGRNALSLWVKRRRALSQGCTLGWYASTLWVKRAVFSEVAHAVHVTWRSRGCCQRGSWGGPVLRVGRVWLAASYATPSLVRHAQRWRLRQGWKELAREGGKKDPSRGRSSRLKPGAPPALPETLGHLSSFGEPVQWRTASATNACVFS